MKQVLVSLHDKFLYYLRVIRSHKWTEREKFLLFLLILITFNLYLLYKTQSMRQYWFGKIAHPNTKRTWQTCSTVKFVNNWLREGAWKLRFLMLEVPKSIEARDIPDREPYISYPPGSVIPVYLVAKFFGFKQIDHKFVMAFNIVLEWFVALFLALTVFLVLRYKQKYSYSVSLGFSLAVLVPFYFNPANIAWFQNSFFSDQMVLLPFVIYIFLEVLREIVPKGWAKVCVVLSQFLVAFWGSFTDWLFFSLLLIVMIFRFRKERGIFRRLIAAIEIWSPFALALILFYLQVKSIGPSTGTPEFTGLSFFQKLQNFILSKYETRGFPIFIFKYSDNVVVNIISNVLDAIFVLWDYIKWYSSSLSIAFSKLGTYIYFSIAFILLYFFWKDRDNELLKLFALFALTTFLHTFIFFHHSAGHPFTVQKFALWIALEFVVLPIYFLEKFLKINLRTISLDGLLKMGSFTFKLPSLNPLLVYPLVLFLFFSLLPYTYYSNLFTKLIFKVKSPPYERIVAVSTFLGYRDIPISVDPVLVTPPNPPHALSFSNKRIYFLWVLKSVGGIMIRVPITQEIATKVKRGKLTWNDFNVVVIVPKCLPLEKLGVRPRSKLDNYLASLLKLVKRYSVTVREVDDYEIYRMKGEKFRIVVEEIAPLEREIANPLFAKVSEKFHRVPFSGFDFSEDLRYSLGGLYALLILLGVLIAYRWYHYRSNTRKDRQKSK